MMLLHIILCTLAYPFLVKARRLTDNTTSNHNEMVHKSIQDFVKMMQNLKTDESEDYRSEHIEDYDYGHEISNTSFCLGANLIGYIRAAESMENVTSMNLEKFKSNIIDDRLANVIDSLESMQNATSFSIQIIFTAISKLIAGTNKNILKAIDSAEKIQNLTSNIIRTAGTAIDSVDVFYKIHNATSINIQTVISAVNENLAGHGNFAYTVDSIIDDSLTNFLNQTVGMISNSEEINNQEFANTIKTLKYKGENDTIPEGFSEYDGRTVLLPSALGGTHSISWYDSLLRCLYNGAVPFIPRSLEDFRFTQSVISELVGGSGLWVAASDHVTEGEFRWYDGTDARPILSTFEWQSGYAGDNDENLDCVNTWRGYDNKLEIENCTSTGGSMWPMICEIL